MIQKRSVCDSIVDAIIEKIKNKILLPGDKLPTEADMCTEFGVSRISIREALRILSARGLVVTRHGEGSFINQYHPHLLVETLQNLSLLNDAPILEMLQLRKIMETEATRLCAVNATDSELSSIKKHMEKREYYCSIKQSPSSTQKKYNYDTLFHKSIIYASHNIIFIKFIETIMSSIDIHQKVSSSSPLQMNYATYYHREIFSALEERNQEKAGRMMYEHLSSVEKIVASR